MKKASVIFALATTAFLLFPTVSEANQYHVEKGDTLYNISQRFGMSLKDLILLNPHFENPNVIHVGDPVNLRSRDVASDVVEYARSLQDVTTYSFGGQQAPERTDCSGWVQHIYKKFGIDLPRVSRDQARTGTPVTFQELKKGDLMFFSSRADKVITHVGIYMGDDYWISNLNESKDVQILSTWGQWTQRYFMWGTRVI